MYYEFMYYVLCSQLEGRPLLAKWIINSINTVANNLGHLLFYFNGIFSLHSCFNIVTEKLWRGLKAPCTFFYFTLVLTYFSKIALLLVYKHRLESLVIQASSFSRSNITCIWRGLELFFPKNKPLPFNRNTVFLKTKIIYILTHYVWQDTAWVQVFWKCLPLFPLVCGLWQWRGSDSKYAGASAYEGYWQGPLEALQ